MNGYASSGSMKEASGSPTMEESLEDNLAGVNTYQEPQVDNLAGVTTYQEPQVDNLAGVNTNQISSTVLNRMLFIGKNCFKSNYNSKYYYK